MNEKILNYWIMYHEIHRFKRLGFSSRRIAQHFELDSRTVRKYLNMTEAQYEAFLMKNQNRNKTLNPYEDFVKAKLNSFPDTSTAQIFDWLKESHPDLPKVSVRTVYNFTMFVRQKHNIPIVSNAREYELVEELPYGSQAQVDFGVYNMLTANGKRKKVWFFAMVLSRSRMKYICFSDIPFTSLSVCQAHENSFSFFQGVPKTIVYDQDRIMMVDENLGDLVLTKTFKDYTRERSFELHFCRKADPESKGKVENVVQYVKKNFLYNRIYHSEQTLNQEAIAWLERTANALAHNYTKKIPSVEFLVEQEFLKPHFPLKIEDATVKPYLVRKNNAVNYKSNFYSVPYGTHQKGITEVVIRERSGMIEILSLTGDLICTHKKETDKGQTITKTNHKRDRSKSIANMTESVTRLFASSNDADVYIAEIKSRFPRYIRDHLQRLLKVLNREDNTEDLTNLTLKYCIKNQLFSAVDFEQVWLFHQTKTLKDQKSDSVEIKPLNGSFSLEKMHEMPAVSDIDHYVSILNA